MLVKPKVPFQHLNLELPMANPFFSQITNSIAKRLQLLALSFGFFCFASSLLTVPAFSCLESSCASAPGTTDRAFSPSALGSVACSSPSAILSFFLAAASLVSVCEILPLVFLISISTVMRSARFLSLIRH